MEIKVKVIKVLVILLNYADKSENNKYNYGILLNYGEKVEVANIIIGYISTMEIKSENNKNNYIYIAALWR